MTESLRDRVELAISDHLDGPAYALGDVMRATIARAITSVVFDTLKGARPCVTCGKSIGPNKVAKGYVQCYGCSHPEPT